MDTLTSVIVANEHIYGVAAVTTALVKKARGLHGASPTAAAALGRLLTGGVLMGSLLKDAAHRVTLQVSSKGPVRSILVEANGAGQVRGYLGQPAINVPSRNGKLDVSGAVGKGILHVIRETGASEPDSGTVPLVSGEIAEDLASYFVQSEQIPSAVSLGVLVTPTTPWPPPASWCNFTPTSTTIWSFTSNRPSAPCRPSPPWCATDTARKTSCAAPSAAWTLTSSKTPLPSGTAAVPRIASSAPSSPWGRSNSANSSANNPKPRSAASFAPPSTRFHSRNCHK